MAGMYTSPHSSQKPLIEIYGELAKIIILASLPYCGGLALILPSRRSSCCVNGHHRMRSAGVEWGADFCTHENEIRNNAETVPNGCPLL